MKKGVESMPHVNKEMISFFLTSKCNLRCVYCYNSKKRENEPIQILDMDFAKAGIDYFFGNFQSRHIRFYGPGEPTQAFSLMQKIRNYAYSKAGEEIKVELQTNGAFSEQIRKWISENVNIVWVSFDGTPDIHDRNRPFPNKVPSSPIIEGNVKYLVANIKKGMVGVRVTITSDNMHRQLEMVNYFVSLGVKHIWCDPIFQEVLDKPVCMSPERKDFHFDMDQFVRTYVEAYRYAQSIGVFYGTNLIYNFDGCVEYNCRACTPVPHLTPDGYVSACDMVTFGGKANHMEPLVYGKWDAENKKILFYKDRIKALRSRKSCNMPACSKCEVAGKCAGYCLGETLNETGSLFGCNPLVCSAVKKLYHEIGDISYEYFHP